MSSLLKKKVENTIDVISPKYEVPPLVKLHKIVEEFNRESQKESYSVSIVYHKDGKNNTYSPAFNEKIQTEKDIVNWLRKTLEKDREMSQNPNLKYEFADESYRVISFYSKEEIGLNKKDILSIKDKFKKAIK